jgi:hypothetical protein
MNMRTRSYAFLPALALASSLLMPAPANQTVISGQVTHQGIQKLNSLSWYGSLAQAQDAAMRSGKMIFWLHILGQVDGAT